MTAPQPPTQPPAQPPAQPPTPAPNGLPPAPAPQAWPPPDASIVAYNVSRSFSGLVAVSDISLAVRPGVTGLLGPNGAGKSTLLRMLSGQIAPSLGKVWVAGGDPRTDVTARSRIGLVPQQDGVFERETALAVVRLSAVLSKLPNATEVARWALQQVELDPDLARPVGSFSKGMRQRVKIAQALVHQPAVFMMDEPLNGLDPRQRRQMIELFHRLGADGRTVLVSSHVLEEVERFGSDVIVIAKGRLAAQGDFRAIRALMDNQPARVRLGCQQANVLAADLVASGAVKSCDVIGPELVEITTTNIRRFRTEVAAASQRHQLRLREVAPLDDDLESVFRYLVGSGGQ